MHRMLEVASRGLALSALAGAAYLAVALVRVKVFSRRRSDKAAPALGISLLKPLHGLEEGLEENLASFCAQDHPAFQVIFCAVDQDDPALKVARRVIERFPTVDATVVVGPASNVANPKIANVLNGYARARYGIVAIADADMRVDPQYLRSVAAAFDAADVGAVTCLYGGVASNGAASELAAMFVNDHFAPSVLVAQSIEPLTYCFGSTMAARKSVVDELGGLAALGTTIADDYALGALTTKAGYRVVLAPYVVANVMSDATLGALWERELRWARTIRAVRPLGSTLAVITYPLPLAFLAWTLRPRSGRRMLLLAVTAILRLALHGASRTAFAPSMPLRPHLIPVRDGLALAVWAVSRLGNNARWHGHDIAVN